MHDLTKGSLARNLIHFVRIPQLLVFSTIQPIIFVLLWRYVFGGAVRIQPGVPYVDYLMPGIFVQTVVFGAIATAIGLAADVKTGLLERFLSLPMSRSAVLFGRTTADMVRNIFVVLLMVGVGFKPFQARAPERRTGAGRGLAESRAGASGMRHAWYGLFFPTDRNDPGRAR